MADLLAEVHQFQVAARGLGGDEEADQSAEAHAVCVLKVGEIEDDALGLGNERGDSGGEDAGGSGDQATVAMQNEDVPGAALNVDGKDRVRCGGRHREPASVLLGWAHLCRI